MKRFAFALVLVAAAAACDKDPKVPQGPTPDNANEQKTLDEFKRRVDQYVELHKQAEAKLPKLSDNSTPEQIDKSQRELLRLISEARANAQQGELFTPDMEALVRKTMTRVFKAPDGGAIKDSVMDENPVGQVPIKVNQRYPDEVPISTMPPDVLQKLPKMPEDLEYRFVGRHLVILDSHAHLIVDFVTNAIPQ